MFEPHKPPKPMQEIIDEQKVKKKLEDKRAEIAAVERYEDPPQRGWESEATKNRIDLYFKR